jgi:hypothetical protein
MALESSVPRHVKTELNGTAVFELENEWTAATTDDCH